MSKWKCNACGGTYSDTQRDGSLYFHACGPEIVHAGEADGQGQIVKPRVERERHNKRDENLTPGLAYDVAQQGYFTPNPEDPTGSIFHPGPVPIISEGAGRTAVDGE